MSDELDPSIAGTVLPVRPPSDASRIPRRFRSSAGASILAAGLIGLRDVVDPAKIEDGTEQEQPAGEVTASGDIEVYLDPDDPAASMVVVRDSRDYN